MYNHMVAMKRNGKRRYRKLDQIRLYLCLAVFLYHMNLLKGGYLAVSAFFVLSGYLSIVSLNGKKFSFGSYYLNRLKRLYLPLLAAAFLSIGIISLFPSIRWLNLKTETTSVIFAYNNFWQLNADKDYFVRNAASPFTHLWYISILMQYDLLLPLFYLPVKLASRRISRIIPLAACLLLAAGSYLCFVLIGKNDLMSAYYGTFPRSFSMFLGMLLGFADPLIGEKENALSGILFYLELAVMSFLFLTVDAASKQFDLAMLAVSILCMLLIIHGKKTNGRKDTVSLLLSFLSSYTYEIYLLQYPVIFLFGQIRMPDSLKAIPVFLLTAILAYMVREALALRRKKVFTFVLCALLLCADGFGVCRYLTEKDHTAEMEELQQMLNENQKLIEEKNKEYLQNKDKRKEDWKILEEDFGSDEENVRAMLRNAPVTGIGDSILLDLAPGLYERFPNGYFDGKISRDLYHGNEILEELKDTDELGEIVVLCLATNGDYIESYNAKLMEIMEEREVFWVNAVGPDDPRFNERFADFAKNYPNLHIVDWEKASRGHPEYFYYDNIHVIGDGVTALTETIYDAIFDVYLEKYRQQKEEIRDERNSTVIFCGNDILIAAYPYLYDVYPEAAYRSQDADFESLCRVLEAQIKDNTLEHKIVFLYDSRFSISWEEYEKLIGLCQEYELYICRIFDDIPEFDDGNVKVIDFRNRLRENRDYLLADGFHLSQDGCIALTEAIKEALK